MLRLIFWILVIGTVYSLIGAAVAYFFVDAAFCDLPMMVTIGIMWPIVLVGLLLTFIVGRIVRFINKIINIII